MATALKKPVTRRVGALVVMIDRDGVVLRGFRSPRKYRATWEQIAYAALKNSGTTNLSGEEWQQPLDVLTHKAKPSWRVRGKAAR